VNEHLRSRDTSRDAVWFGKIVSYAVSHKGTEEHAAYEGAAGLSVMHYVISFM